MDDMRYILTTIDMPQEGLDEIEELLGERPLVIKTKEQLRPKWNPYHASIWGDFDHMRSLFPSDATNRCFVTSVEALRDIGITGHIGMYDAVSRDGVHDFYFGLPKRLDSRAKSNGFKTNLAWLFIHELLHGKERAKGGVDNTHTMEEQGRLKELLETHIVDIVEAPMNVPEVVITHHALSGDHHTHKDVDKWHTERWPHFVSRLGYRIGYHYIIERDGTVVQTRHHDEEGAHTLGMNRSSIGVCFIGNFDTGTPAQAQIDAWIDLYNKLRADYPNIPTSPHRAFQARTCHGTNLSDDYFDLHYQKWGILLQVKSLVIRLVDNLTRKIYDKNK
jgi:N-acetylmuramoyl-L-alanine amidase